MVPSAEACLLGTNVVMPLGLMVLYEGVEARGGSKQPISVVPVSVSHASICLVGVQQIPSRSAVIVCAEAKGCLNPSGLSAVFEPGC